MEDDVKSLEGKKFTIFFYKNSLMRFLRIRTPLTVKISFVEKRDVSSLHGQDFFIKHLQIYNFDIKEISRVYDLVIKSSRNILNSTVGISFFKDSSLNKYGVIEIQDIRVDSKYRSKGMGSHVMQYLEKIAADFEVCFIVGDLQKDRSGESLVDRVEFFKGKGFDVIETDKSKFSGYIVKKEVYK